MKSAQCILVLSQVIFALAKPLPVIESLDLVLEARDAPVFRIAGRGGGNDRNNNNNNNGDDDDDGDNENEGAAPPAENGRENGQAEGGEEAGEGEGAENEVEQAGQFDVPITLPGGNKVDTLYPPGQNGVFEIEFQNADSRTLTVTQNPNPAAPPPGFVAVEPVSFIVSVAEGTQGLTLQKVDYILNKNNTLDISKGAIGKFSAEANAFVIDPALGEQEFELEENELLIKTNDMNGEWAAFIPQAAPAAPPAAPPAAGGASATVQEFVGLLVSMLSAGAAPPAQAAEDRK